MPLANFIYFIFDEQQNKLRAYIFIFQINNLTIMSEIGVKLTRMIRDKANYTFPLILDL